LSDIPQTINFDSSDVCVIDLTLEHTIDQEFECTNGEYTDYYKVQASYDLQENLARTKLMLYKGKVIGFISIAMAHMEKERSPITIGKQTAGTIPALLISHLATHKQYRRKKVATRLVDQAVSIAVGTSEKIGCRYVMLNPENDDEVRKFYSAYGFTYLEHDDRDNHDAFILDIKLDKKQQQN